VENKLTILTDEQLLCNICDRDQAAFTELVHRHLQCLIKFSARYTLNISFSEDIVQESFLRVWDSANNWSAEKGTVKSWLYKIAYNLSIDFLRKQKLQQTHQEDLISSEATMVCSPEENLLGSEKEDQFSQALSSLPERQRTALTLFLFNGLSGVEVAAVLELTIDASDSLLARARRNLKKFIREESLTKKVANL